MRMLAVKGQIFCCVGEDDLGNDQCFSQHVSPQNNTGYPAAYAGGASFLATSQVKPSSSRPKWP